MNSIHLPSIKKYLLSPSLALVICLTGSTTHAQTIDFEALGGQGGVKSSSSYVHFDSHGHLATVIKLGADRSKATLSKDGNKIPLTFVVTDSNSRLVIYKLPNQAKPITENIHPIGDSTSLAPAQSLYTSPNKREDVAKVVGRISNFQKKTLPFTVIQLNHSKAAPRQGSGVYDDQGKLVGLIRQAVFGNPNSSYLLPVEVISRTLEDLKKNAKIHRCWIGIVMDKLVDPPIVESVRPGGPAAKAGIKTGDVILSIGNQKVTDYSEVVNAFFYLIAGESKVFTLLRGIEVKVISVTPEVSP